MFLLSEDNPAVQVGGGERGGGPHQPHLVPARQHVRLADIPGYEIYGIW